MDRLLGLLRANRGTVIVGALIVVSGLGASQLIGLPPAFMGGLLVVFGLATWGIFRWRTRRLDSRPQPAPARTLASSALVALVAVFLAAHAVPYGRDHSNPLISGEPDWANVQTRQLMVRACFDCHSNEVVWP